MGAIVTIKLPEGVDPAQIKDQIKQLIEEKTGESVTVSINPRVAPIGLPKIQNERFLPNVGFNSFLSNN
jgi:hypothetical protein